MPFAGRLLKEGARVAIADIRGAEEAAVEFGGLGDCIGVDTDVADEASVEGGFALHARAALRPHHQSRFGNRDQGHANADALRRKQGCDH